MPNKKSAIKRVRQNERRRLRNRAKRGAMRTAIKKFNHAIEHNQIENLEEVARDAQAKLGKAAKTKLIKKNAMARYQSRLMKAAHKAKLHGASEESSSEG